MDEYDQVPGTNENGDHVHRCVPEYETGFVLLMAPHPLVEGNGPSRRRRSEKRGKRAIQGDEAREANAFGQNWEPMDIDQIGDVDLGVLL